MIVITQAARQCIFRRGRIGGPRREVDRGRPACDDWHADHTPFCPTPRPRKAPPAKADPGKARQTLPDRCPVPDHDDEITRAALHKK